MPCQQFDGLSFSTMGITSRKCFYQIVGGVHRQGAVSTGAPSLITTHQDFAGISCPPCDSSRRGPHFQRLAVDVLFSRHFFINQPQIGPRKRRQGRLRIYR